MKKTMINKALAIAIAMFMAMAGVNLPFMGALTVHAAEDTLAHWSYPSPAPAPTLNNLTPYSYSTTPDNSGRKLTVTGGVALSASLVSGPTGFMAITSTGWDSGKDTKYWMVSISTKGYSNIKISSIQRSSDTGPKDFKLQYRFNDSEWTDAEKPITVANNFSGTVDNYVIPSDPIANKEIAYLRWIMTSNAPVVSTKTLASAGTSRICEIKIVGTSIPTPTPTPYSVSVTNSGNGTVVANPVSATVNENGTVTFTISPDSGYQIKTLKFNDADVLLTPSGQSYTTPPLNATNTTNYIANLDVKFAKTPSIKKTTDSTPAFKGAGTTVSNYRIATKSYICYSTISNTDALQITSFGMTLEDITPDTDKTGIKIIGNLR